MSHFPVLVITNEEDSYEVDGLLAKYSEHIQMEPYIKYTKAEAIKKSREYVAESIKYLSERDDENSKKWLEKYLSYKTDEDFYNHIAEGYETDEEGNLYSTYNPDSKWDWYVVGGRFGDCLKDKNGNYIDEGYACDISFERDEKIYKHAKRFWELVVEEKKPRKNEEVPFTLYSKEYYLKYYRDKEHYADISSKPIFRAVVTPDGVWHEKGQVGWFATSTETPEESIKWDEEFMDRFIKPVIEQNQYLTVVDCHI